MKPDSGEARTDLDEEGGVEAPPLTARSAAWAWPLLALAALGALGLALTLAGGIAEGGTYRFDSAILVALRRPGDLARPIGPAWMTLSATDISALGGFTLQWLLGAAAIGFLLYSRQRAEAAWLGASIVGASVLNAVLKVSLHRARPQIVPHLTPVDNASFPSGHAMISAAILLTVGAMLAETQSRTGARAWLMAAAGVLVFLIGVSRLYLGVHWPSDVLAGWCLGAVWAAVVFAANRALRRRAKKRSMFRR